MLARAKDAPLHLAADFRACKRKVKRFYAFHNQLGAHAARIRSLTIVASSIDLWESLNLLKWPAPALESLSLSIPGMLDSRSSPRIGDEVPHLFNCTTPRLTRVELINCYIDWSSPLLKGLRHLMLLYTGNRLFTQGWSHFQSWLDAMGELSQLESLTIHNATPIATRVREDMPELTHAVELPCLTRLHISTISADDCTLALAYLRLPVLTWLCVEVMQKFNIDGDIGVLMPYFARNANGPQDEMPLQSMVIGGKESRDDILLWTDPGADAEYLNNASFTRATRSTRASLNVSISYWDFDPQTTILDTALAALPIGSLATLTVLNFTEVTRPLWLRHAPQWPLLKRIWLGKTALPPFIDAMIDVDEDTPPEGPLLPSLEELVITGPSLTMDIALRLRDMLLLRVKQGVPIQSLDLRRCAVPGDAMRLFGDIVANTQGPKGTKPPWKLRIVRPLHLTTWVFHEELGKLGDEDEDEEEE